MTPHNETERYDLEEDLANDIKRHDNPHHPSGHQNEVQLSLAEDELNDYFEGEENADL